MSWTINEQSKTSETQYFIANYTTLSLLTDALLSSITQQTTGAAAASYTNITSTTSGTGTGATFNVTVGGGGTVTSITVVITGKGYKVGDTITIANGLIGGGGTDLIITLVEDDFTSGSNSGIVVPGISTSDSNPIDVAGYIAGTFSLSISPAPSTWASGNIEINIIGGIDITNTVITTIVIDNSETDSVFQTHWGIPLERVFLRINNNTGPPFAPTVTISNINLITGSNGGGLGFNSTSGVSAGPAGAIPDIQYNDEGLFGGSSGAKYNNTNTQMLLADGTESIPIISFPRISTAAGALLSSIKIQTTGATPNTYAGIASTTSGSGTGAIFTIVVGGGGTVTGVTVTTQGSGYRIGDTITIARGLIGGGTTDLVFELVADDFVNNGIYRPTANQTGLTVNNSLVAFSTTNTTGAGTSGFTVNTALALTRTSSSTSNSWEDGHLGNSQQLIFTGSDFSNWNARIRNVVSFTVAADPIAPVGGTGFAMQAAAGPAGNQIIGVKLLPKGFRISERRVAVTGNSTLTPSWLAGSSIEILTQDISEPGANPISLGSQLMTTWLSGSNTEYTTQASVTGTGTIAIVVRINIASGRQITSSNALTGVIIGMERI